MVEVVANNRKKTFWCQCEDCDSTLEYTINDILINCWFFSENPRSAECCWYIICPVCTHENLIQPPPMYVRRAIPKDNYGGDIEAADLLISKLQTKKDVGRGD